MPWTDRRASSVVRIFCAAAIGWSSISGEGSTARAAGTLAHRAAACADDGWVAGQISSVQVDAYTPPLPLVRDELRLLSHADTATLRRAVLRHFELDSPPAEHHRDTEIPNVLTATCQWRDVGLSAAKAVIESAPALDGLDENTRLAASVAYRDLFSGLYAKSKVSKAAYDRATVGFEALLPPGSSRVATFPSEDAATPAPCAGPNSDVSIAGIPARAEYPEIAREQGAVGSTLVKVSIDVAGNAVDGNIFKSSGSAVLDQSALRAAAASHYNPAIVDCIKTPGSFLFRADFDGS
jgi:TonB family protein